MSISPVIRIGTRESQLAVWQADLVKTMLEKEGHACELVFIKSEGDTDMKTPLYEMGVQGIFTKALDIALLNQKIDLAVHSMKDVPVVLAAGLQQVAVLKRASSKDLLVPKLPIELHDKEESFPFHIATSSLRRKAQWLNRYPLSRIDNLRGNVNTRLRKLQESEWHGAIFAAAGLERIGLRPAAAIDLDWMLPAPAQGAIMVAARMEDTAVQQACAPLNHEPTATCVKAERDFLKTLMGGCTAPISALAKIDGDNLMLEGQLLSVDGREKLIVSKHASLLRSYSIGVDAALEILDNGGDRMMKEIRKVAG